MADIGEHDRCLLIVHLLPSIQSFKRLYYLSKIRVFQMSHVRVKSLVELSDSISFFMHVIEISLAVILLLARV